MIRVMKPIVPIFIELKKNRRAISQGESKMKTLYFFANTPSWRPGMIGDTTLVIKRNTNLHKRRDLHERGLHKKLATYLNRSVA